MQAKRKRQLLVQPKRFFGAQTLQKITTETLVTFREWRVSAAVGPAIINMEMGVIRRLLKKAKRWHLVGAEIKPLREPRSIGRALSHSEKVKLLTKAKSRPEWHNARLAAMLALNTTMRGCEIKNLRWGDVDLLSRVFSVRKSKTEAGERTIPINDTALTVIRELRERAQFFSGTEPEHFLFPACEHERIDPTRPMKSWRSAWRHITKAAGIPRTSIPRSASPRNYRARRVAGKRSDDHECGWARLTENAGALLPCSDGSEETRLGCTVAGE